MPLIFKSSGQGLESISSAPIIALRHAEVRMVEPGVGLDIAYYLSWHVGVGAQWNVEAKSSVYTSMLSIRHYLAVALLGKSKYRSNAATNSWDIMGTDIRGKTEKA
jgi:hypothetical protein